jgi:peptide/nickel transport system permease protein
MSATPMAGNLAIAPQKETKRRSEMGNAWRRFSRNRAAVVGLVMVIILCLLAIFAPVIAPADPNESFPGMRGVGPSLEHPMGFDHIGRDMFSRVLYGTRYALIVAFAATFLAATIGVLIGAVAGYFSGWTDSVLSRLTDTLMAFPVLALLIVLSAVLGPSLVTTIVVIGVTSWARYCRVVRADILALRQTDFVIAARAVGSTSWRVIASHLIPNVMTPVIVLASLGVGGVIILESSLSFLGLGLQRPTPSWGIIISDGVSLIRDYPHISAFPGMMIFITVLAFNLVGDGLRDALDPKQRT